MPVATQLDHIKRRAGGNAQALALSNRELVHACVLAGRQQICPNLPRGDQQLIKLQVVIAEAAWNGRATGKILIHKWTNYVLLKTLLVIYHIIWNAEALGYPACIVNILDRAAASLH